MPTPAPIRVKSVPSTAVAKLKCDPTPRLARNVINSTSTIIDQPTTVLAHHKRHRELQRIIPDVHRHEEQRKRERDGL